jgi:hypothetical protein
MKTKGSLRDAMGRLHSNYPALMPMGETLGFMVESIEPGSAAVVIDTGDRHADVIADNLINIGRYLARKPREFRAPFTRCRIAGSARKPAPRG